MTGKPILVTGATSNAGREVMRALNVRGVPLRAGVRSPARARTLLGDDAPLVRLDFEDPGTWDDALAECGGVFLLRPPSIANVKATLNPFIDRARQAGAEHVVFLSVAGAGDNSFVPHHEVERHLQGCSAPYTGKAYTLTGPEALSFSEVAQLLTEVVGRPIRYEPASIPGYLRHLRRRKLGWGQSMVQAILHVGLRHGQAERVDPTLEHLLGRPGRTLETYVTKDRAIWSSSAAASGSPEA